MKKLLGILLLCLSFNSFAVPQYHSVVLVTTPTCPACAQAKQILSAHGVRFSVRSPTSRDPAQYVPMLYVDGKYKGVGVGAVEAWVNS